MNSTDAQDTYALQRDLALEEQRLSDVKFEANPGLDHPRVVAEMEKAIQPLRDRVAERQAEVGGVVFRIPEENISLLQEKIAKLNKRAAKLDVEPVSLTLHETIEIKGKDHNGRDEYRNYQFVAVKGHSPRLAGWRFVATLEHDENGVILRKLPTFEGEVDLTPYRTATPENCDHCKLVRRRNDTYVVQHEDGSLKQVGSNCLTDFLGGASPQQIARWMEFLADFVDELENEDSEFYGGSAPSRVVAREYMAHVACMVRENGWTSRGSAYNYGGYATADAAESNMYNQASRKSYKGERLWIDPIDADYAAADKAIEWVRALPEDQLESDYLYNLFTVFKGESLGKRQLGIAASAITAHSKAVEKQIKAEAAKASEFVGAEGDKLEIEVTIVNEIRLEDNYSYHGGTKPLYMMQDAAGNSLKWFASRDIDGMEQGNTVTIKGTVKAHQMHEKYGKSTILTRCKIV